MGFFRQEYWSGLPFPTPGDLLNPGIKHTSLAFPALAGEFFTTSHPLPNTQLWDRHRITPIDMEDTQESLVHTILKSSLAEIGSFLIGTQSQGIILHGSWPQES